MSGTLQGILVLVGLGLVLTLLIYIRARYTGPQSQKSALEKPPFTQLIANGFELKGDYLTGIINNYTVVIRYEFVPHAHIRMDVLFDHTYLDRVYNDDEIKQLNKRHYKNNWKSGPENRFFPNFAMTEMSVRNMRFRLRTNDEIIEKAEQLIDILQIEGLKPVGMKEIESFG